ncbi:MAG: dihydrodipicolinate synthase family protein [Thermomicrobiales bacterium]
MAQANIPDGVWPVMLTPFNEDKMIDWDGVDALTDWYIEAGVSGLFAVAQSSEMYALSDLERLKLAYRVVERADGRVPVVATGTFGGSIEQQADSVRRMADTGVQAVITITSQLAAQSEEEDVWRAKTETLLDLTENISLGLYECPAPYKRLLSPDALRWAAQTGRFVFHKDTCLSLREITAKIAAIVGTPLKFFNAEISSLSDSLSIGGNGFSGVAANFYPEHLVWLCEHWAEAEASELQYFLSVAEMVIDHKYPSSAKYFLRETRSAEISTICRVPDQLLTEHDRRTIIHLAECLKTLDFPVLHGKG